MALLGATALTMNEARITWLTPERFDEFAERAAA
jgi:hypothetical protein